MRKNKMLTVFAVLVFGFLIMRWLSLQLLLLVRAAPLPSPLILSPLNGF